MRNFALVGTIVCHYLLVGADLFAQVSITPIALSAPPASLAMYQGDYVYNSAMFWQVTNTIGLIFLIAALALHWRSARRNLLLATFVGTVIISGVSLGYIFPEYTAIVSSAYSDTVDPALLERGASWRVVAFSRLSIFGALGLLPLLALSKPLDS